MVPRLAEGSRSPSHGALAPGVDTCDPPAPANVAQLVRDRSQSAFGRLRRQPPREPEPAIARGQRLAGDCAATGQSHRHSSAAGGGITLAIPWSARARCVTFVAPASRNDAHLVSDRSRVNAWPSFGGSPTPTGPAIARGSAWPPTVSAQSARGTIWIDHPAGRVDVDPKRPCSTSILIPRTGPGS